MTLLLEYPCGRLRRIERAVQVHPHDTTPLVRRVIFSRDVGDDAGVDDDDV